MAKKKNPDLVSTGKPKSGGAVFVAPAGTTVPTDALTELSEAFKCLGCISEDGVVNTQSSESEDFADWEGDTVDTSRTKYTETLQMTFLEAANPDVLAYVYGESHVEVTEATGAIHVEHTGDDRDECVLVVDTILKGKRIDRLVAPRAVVGEIGDVSRKRNELMGYQATIKALAGSDGVPVHEYIGKKADTPSTPEVTE